MNDGEPRLFTTVTYPTTFRNLSISAFESRLFMMRYSPSTQLVEKKQMFWVSREFSWVKSGEQVWGSDSPDKHELSTWHGRQDGS